MAEDHAFRESLGQAEVFWFRFGDLFLTVIGVPASP